MVLGVSLLLLGCGAGNNDLLLSEAGVNRHRDSYLQCAVHNLNAANASSLNLKQSISEFLALPEESTLNAAQAAWQQARQDWARAEVFNLVALPVETGKSAAREPETMMPLRQLATKRVDAWPLNPLFIERIISGGSDSKGQSYALTSRNLEALNNSEDEVAVTLGLRVVEFLLWSSGDQKSMEKLLQAYAPNQPQTERRRRYLQLASDQLADDLSQLRRAWVTGEGSYSDRLQRMDARAALQQMLMGVVTLLEQEMALRSLVVPLKTGNVQLQQSVFSESSLTDLSANLAGIEEVMFGTGECKSPDGILALLKLVAPAHADRVQRQLKLARGAVAGIHAPLHATISEQAANTDRLIMNALIDALVAAAQSLREAAVALQFELPGGNSRDVSG